jgi:hypothetical protein
MPYAAATRLGRQPVGWDDGVVAGRQPVQHAAGSESADLRTWMCVGVGCVDRTQHPVRDARQPRRQAGAPRRSAPSRLAVLYYNSRTSQQYARCSLTLPRAVVDPTVAVGLWNVSGQPDEERPAVCGAAAFGPGGIVATAARDRDPLWATTDGHGEVVLRRRLRVPRRRRCL